MLGWEGQSVGQYRVLEALGSGAMGVVHKALDERLGRHIALKFLPRHLGVRPEAKRRFLQEARAAAALSHPNVVAVYDLGESEGLFFIVMELASGTPLLSFAGDATVPVLGGRLSLGTWQSICLVDLNVDNPDREVRLSFLS